jgi:predicted DNA-binding protein
MAPEIRFTITERLDEILQAIARKYGVDKSDYVRSLIINDLREKEMVMNAANITKSQVKKEAKQK